VEHLIQSNPFSEVKKKNKIILIYFDCMFSLLYLSILNFEKEKNMKVRNSPEVTVPDGLIRSGIPGTVVLLL